MNHSIYNIKQLQDNSPGESFYRANYNFAIANWLTHCRETHSQICKCPSFRNHWHQTPALVATETQTQTSPARQERPLTPQPNQEMERAIAGLSAPQTPIQGPMAPNDLCALLFGKPGGGEQSTNQDRGHRRGGNNKKVKRTLDFYFGRHRHRPYPRTRSRRRCVEDDGPTDDSTDFTGEDGTTSEDPEDDGIAPVTAALAKAASIAPSGEKSSAHSSIHTRALTW